MEDTGMKTKVRQESEAGLRRQIHAKIATIAKTGICMPGTLVRKSRKCGNPRCACANGGPLHPACTVTSRDCGRTKAVYIPVDMIPEEEADARNRGGPEARQDRYGHPVRPLEAGAGHLRIQFRMTGTRTHAPAQARRTFYPFSTALPGGLRYLVPLNKRLSVSCFQ